MSTQTCTCRTERSSWKDEFFFDKITCLSLFFGDLLKEYRNFEGMFSVGFPKSHSTSPEERLYADHLFVKTESVFGNWQNKLRMSKKLFERDSKTLIDLSRRNIRKNKKNSSMLHFETKFIQKCVSITRQSCHNWNFVSSWTFYSGTVIWSFLF